MGAHRRVSQRRMTRMNFAFLASSRAHRRHRERRDRLQRRPRVRHQDVARFGEGLLRRILIGRAMNAGVGARCRRARWGAGAQHLGAANPYGRRHLRIGHRVDLLHVGAEAPAIDTLDGRELVEAALRPLARPIDRPPSDRSPANATVPHEEDNGRTPDALRTWPTSRAGKGHGPCRKWSVSRCEARLSV